jgi:hypothetical protein
VIYRNKEISMYGLTIHQAPRLTDSQVRWLGRIIQTRIRLGKVDQAIVPDDVQDALMAKGLIQWHLGMLEATVDGIRQWARLRPL